MPKSPKRADRLTPRELAELTKMVTRVLVTVVIVAWLAGAEGLFALATLTGSIAALVRVVLNRKD